jgi:hypothetical protein
MRRSSGFVPAVKALTILKPNKPGLPSTRGDSSWNPGGLQNKASLLMSTFDIFQAEIGDRWRSLKAEN